MKRASIFGYSVDLTCPEDALKRTVSAMETSNGLHVITINPEIIAAADNDSGLAGIVKSAELVIPDSIGIMLAIWSMGEFKARQIPGIDYSERLLKLCAEKKLKVAFLGGQPGVIEKIKIPKVNVVFSHHGYYEDENCIIEELNKAEPDLLLVGLGSPKQDYFISKARNLLKSTVMIGVGGSFDVWAGKVKRAPAVFRHLGLEWFYRLVTQPKRFTRMFPVLPQFFLRILFDRKKLFI